MGSGDDQSSWQAVHDRLTTGPVDELSAPDLDELAHAFFWLNQPRRAIETHQLACRRWQHDGEPERAARSTWFLFYEHWLVGESAVAQGWLERGRRLLDGCSTAAAEVSSAWLDIAEADVLASSDRVPDGLAMATRARAAGERHHDLDLTAMALQSEGRLLIAAGRRRDGLSRLDDAMVSVVANELAPLFTGWVFCNVIGTWHGLGDLRRATQWTDAALEWCETIQDGLLYPGLCRVYAAELAQLRGRWDEAEALGRRAAEDLSAYDDRYAGAAHYLVGEVCRLQGRTAEAMEAFELADRLGTDPQPGRAILAAAAGAPADALASLSLAVEPGHTSSVINGLHALSALVDIAEAAGHDELLVAACDRITQLADEFDNDLTRAHGGAAEAAAARVRGDVGAEIAALRIACDGFTALDMPFDAARQHERLADAANRGGDGAAAAREAAAAAEIFGHLGIARDRPEPSHSLLPELSAREREVLQLVAGGRTNREIADELHLSPHTVARHLANIFAKLGVNTRTAASTIAVRAGLMSPTT